MNVRWSTNDLKTVLTATWDPIASAQGFTFWKDGLRVSYTMDPSRTTARFGLDGQPHMFEIYALGKLDHATTAYPLPVPVPPPATNPAGTAFQAFWDSLAPAPFGWLPPKLVTTRAGLDAALEAAPEGTRIQPRGFVYDGRLALRGKKNIWLDCDPTFEIANPTRGSYGQGLWLVDCANVVVTGFPRVHDCGNQALLDQGSNGCHVEIDARDNGGTGVLINKATTLPISNVYKIRGGNNGLDLGLDPHKQKGTGNHFLNSWQLQHGAIAVDIDDQPYGAGIESCALNGVRLAVRAKTLSCDVNKLPAAPDGTRQTGGNAWQPWDGGAPAPHTDCVVEAIAVGECAQGVYGALGGAGNARNVVKVGRVGRSRLSPVWAPLPGVTYGDIA